jgi:hypothetical protein
MLNKINIFLILIITEDTVEHELYLRNFAADDKDTSVLNNNEAADNGNNTNVIANNGKCHFNSKNYFDRLIIRISCWRENSSIQKTF